MPMQEEIREGIKERLEYDASCHKAHSGWVVDEIIAYLHSKGVVIKVNVPQITGESAKVCYYEELIDG